MILKAEHFTGCIEKIAQAITSMTGRSPTGLKSSSISNNDFNSGSYNSNINTNKKLNINSTMSKSRNKADLQPLHKDSKVISGPTDMGTSRKMGGKQKYLGNIEDKRITFNHLRGR